MGKSFCSLFVAHLQIGPVDITRLHWSFDAGRLGDYFEEMRIFFSLSEEVLSVMLIVESDESFAEKVGEVECRRVVEGEAFAEFNGFVIEDSNLIGDVFEQVIGLRIINSHTLVIDILIHKSFSLLIDSFHFSEIITETDRCDYGLTVYIFFSREDKFIEIFIQMILNLISIIILSYFSNPLLDLIRNFIFQKILILKFNIFIGSIIFMNEDWYIFYKYGELIL